MTYTANHPVDGDDIQTALSTYVNQNITHIVAAITQEHVWDNATATNTVHYSNQYTGVLTRVLNAVGAAVATTGVGFTSDIILFFGIANNYISGSALSVALSIGAYDGTRNRSINSCINGSSGIFPSSSTSYSLLFSEDTSFTSYQRAAVSAVGADGFTLTWTTSGMTSTASAYILYVCLKLT